MDTKFFDNPDLKKVREFMRESGSYLYIPAYQRPFTWTKSNIERFFEDTVSGIKMLMNERESISFIGAMVCFHDQDYKTIDPMVRPDVPAKVLTIVDGQQRLIALTMIAGVLHNDLRTHIHKMPDDWLRDKAIETMNELEEILEEKRTIGETKYYPRMIRAYKDQWAKTLNNSKYTSPLSHFVSDYHSFREGNPDKEYKHKVPQEEGEEHEKFVKIIQSIKSQVKKILSGDYDNMPSVAELLDSKDILSALFNLEEVPSSIDRTKMAERFLAVVLARYILEKIYFVVVTVKHKEDYAFDIFESLNTTGQILTALETFYPEVVKRETIEKFKYSKSKEHLDIINGFLSGLNKENEKIKVTGDLVVNFALAESGDKLTRQLREQRNYLRKRYNECKDNEKINFTHHLMCASVVYQHLWIREKPLCEYPKTPFSGNFSSETEKLLKEADFCLDFLVAAGNDISRAVITRFYEHVCLSPDNEKEKSINNFCSAIKSIAAFFALWRSSRQGTDGIDNRYRALLKGNDGISRKKENVPLVEELRKNLIYFLREDGGNSDYKIDGYEKWKKYCQKPVAIYKDSKAVAKFLLMVSSHNTLPDGDGFLKRARDNVVPPLIDTKTWKSGDYMTVEHIIPQNSNEAKDLGPDEINRLGNLTLLPLSVNSLLSDREWSQRKMIYEILSAKDDKEVQEAQNKNKNLPSPLSKEILEKIGQKARCLPMTKAVSQFDKFEIKEIEEREGSLLTLAWEILAKDWLKWDA